MLDDSDQAQVIFTKWIGTDLIHVWKPTEAQYVLYSTFQMPNMHSDGV